jgi:hypothetical protein
MKAISNISNTTPIKLNCVECGKPQAAQTAPAAQNNAQMANTPLNAHKAYANISFKENKSGLVLPNGDPADAEHIPPAIYLPGQARKASGLESIELHSGLPASASKGSASIHLPTTEEVGRYSKDKVSFGKITNDSDEEYDSGCSAGDATVAALLDEQAAEDAKAQKDSEPEATQEFNEAK